MNKFLQPIFKKKKKQEIDSKHELLNIMIYDTYERKF